jgi:hypothetical protein
MQTNEMLSQLSVPQFDESRNAIRYSDITTTTQGYNQVAAPELSATEETYLLNGLITQVPLLNERY